MNTKNKSEQDNGQKFYSPDGTDIRVTLPDGSVAIVNKARTLPQRFWRQATREGCLVKGGATAAQLAGPKPSDLSDPLNRRDAIMGAMKDAAKRVAASAAAGDDAPPAGYEGAFTRTGTPNVRWLETRLGLEIDGNERDELWTEVQVELDNEEESSEIETEEEEEAE